MLSFEDEMHISITKIDNFTSIDIIRWLSAARNDDEIAALTEVIDRRGKQLFGQHFGLRFDRTIPSRNIRRRVFVKRPRAARSHLIA